MRHRNSGAEVKINELMAFERSLPSGIYEKENLEMSAEYNYELPLIIPNGLHRAASHESSPGSRLTSQSWCTTTTKYLQYYVHIIIH